MTSPNASQTTNRIQVITVSPVIRPPHNTIEISGKNGTSGTRKPRGAVRLRAPQHNHAERDQHECEERADVGEISGVTHRKKSRRNADRETRDPSG